MRKPENKKKKPQKASNSAKGYSQIRQKSSKNSTARKTSQKREERREKARLSIPIDKLTEHLKLKQGEEITCPFCQKPTLELDTGKNECHCSSCKKQANTIKLVKQVLDKTDWQAIAWLEELETSLEKASPKSAEAAKTVQAKEAVPQKAKLSKAARQTSLSIPESDLERIKRETDIVALVRSSGVQLKQQGKDYVGLCPFHPDKNPSLVITPGANKNLFHCFGCGKAGSPIDWVIETENLDFRSAIKWLIDNGYAPFLAGSDNDQTAAKSTKTEPAITDQTLLSQVFNHYHQNLKNTPDAIEYLHKRGIVHPEVVDFFQLGFCSGSLGKCISNKMRKQLKGSGIYNERNREHFTGYLTIPIYDEQGHIVEAYGRKIQKGEPKHLYLPGPHKGLFNPKCLTSPQIVLCEAIFDALSMWIHDIRDVTASFGSQGLTAEMVEMFVRSGVKQVIIAYDWDQGGHKGAEKANYALEQRNIDCMRVRLPDGMDVNQFVLQDRKAGQKLRKLAKDAVPMIQGKLVLSAPAARKEEVQTPKVYPAQQFLL